MTILDRIDSQRDIFIDTKDTVPTHIYLTKQEMQEVDSALALANIRRHEKYLKESLCPDLLPPMQIMPKVEDGVILFGMFVTETQTPGLKIASIENNSIID